MNIERNILRAAEPVAEVRVQPTLFQRFRAAWALWTDPTCPTCGEAKSCPECLIEKNF